MAGGNRDPSMCTMMPHEQLNSRHRAHSDINDATTAGQKTCDDGLFDHLSRSAWIPPNDNGSETNVGTESLSKSSQ
jgi:hypothetical protein